MVGERGVTAGQRIEPDLLTDDGLAVELEAQHLQFANDVSLAESCKPTHVQAATTVV